MTEDLSTNAASLDLHSQRVRAVIADCVERRARGEELPDEAVWAAHADLMPELADALAKLKRVEAAFQAPPASTPKVAEEETDLASPLEVRCPHCQDIVAVPRDSSLHDVACPHCRAAFNLLVSEPSRVDQIGTQIAHFKLIELLGSGGFGAVWRAHDTQLERYVALKLPRRGELSKREAELFFREARAAAQLSHPNIVRVYEVGRHDDSIYIVSDLIEGETLSQLIARGPLAFSRAAELCRNVARALQAAHDANVVHRDLKPSNILLDSAGQPHVTDFGLAKRDAGELTVTADGQVLGTPAYMCPEQARGESHKADARSDVYALGVILFEMLTAERPFRGTPQLLIHQVLYETVPSPRRLNARVPRDLETICLKCLEKRPDQRYASAQALADDLDRWLARQPIQARPVGPLGRITRWCQRKPVLAALIATVILLTVTGLSGVTWQWRQTVAALDEATTAQRRADKNKEDAWGVVDDFLVEVSEVELENEPRMEEVRQRLLAKAVAYYEAIAASNNNDQSVRMDAARAHSRLADLRASLGEIRAAIEDVDRALKILRQLEAEGYEPPQFAHELANAYITRADIRWMHQFKLQFGRASQTVEEDLQTANAILSEQLDRQADDYDCLVGQARTALALGDMYRDSAHPDTVPTLQRAIAAWQRVVQIAPPDDHYARSHLCQTNLGLATYLTMVNQPTKALDYARQAVDTAESLVADHPRDESFRHILANALAASSRCRNLTQGPEAARLTLERSVAIRKQLTNEFPSKRRHFRELSALYFDLSGLCAKMGEFAEAKSYLLACAEIDRQIIGMDTADSELERRQALVQIMLANIYGEEGNLTEAEIAFEYAAQILTPLERGETAGTVRALLQHAYLGIGSVRVMRKNFSQALEPLGQAQYVGRRLVAELPHYFDFQQFLVESYTRRAQALRGLGTPKEALNELLMGESCARQYAANLPDSVNSQWILANYLWEIGALYWQLGQREKARPYLVNSTVVEHITRSNFPTAEAERESYDLPQRHLPTILARQCDPLQTVQLADELVSALDASPAASYLAATILGKCLNSMELNTEDANAAAVNTISARTIELVARAVSEDSDMRARLQADPAFSFLREHVPEWDTVLSNR